MERRNLLTGAAALAATTLFPITDQEGSVQAQSTANDYSSGVTLPEGYERADWVPEYHLDIDPDGTAEVTLTVEGSEVPRTVGLSGRRASEVDILDGDEGLTQENDTRYRWNTTDTDTIVFSASFTGENFRAVVELTLENSIICLVGELLRIVGIPDDVLPETYRFSFDPPSGWAVSGPGVQVDETTFELTENRSPGQTPSSIFALGEFETHEETFDGRTVRAVELPGSDGPDQAEVMQFVGEAMPLMEEYFGLETPYPRFVATTPQGEIHRGGGWAEAHGFGMTDNWDIVQPERGGSVHAHELAHTYQLHAQPVWHSEGMAVWLQYVLPYELGYVSESQLRTLLHDRVGEPRHAPDEDPDELDNPTDVPAEEAPYDKGGGLYAALDMDIQARTGGEAHIGDFITAINDQRENRYEISREAQLEALKDITEIDYEPFYVQYVDGEDAPPEILSDRFSLSEPTTVNFHAQASFSDVEIAPTEVTTSERYEVTAVVTNDGEYIGEFFVELRQDGELADEAVVELAAGDDTTVSLEGSRDISGDYQLTLGTLAHEEEIGTISIKDVGEENGEETESTPTGEDESTPDSSDDEQSTEPTAEPEATEDSAFGFGVSEAILGLGSAGYVLQKKMTSTDDTEQ